MFSFSSSAYRRESWSSTTNIHCCKNACSIACVYREWKLFRLIRIFICHGLILECRTGPTIRWWSWSVLHDHQNSDKLVGLCSVVCGLVIGMYVRCICIHKLTEFINAKTYIWIRYFLKRKGTFQWAHCNFCVIRAAEVSHNNILSLSPTKECKIINKNRWRGQRRKKLYH